MNSRREPRIEVNQQCDAIILGQPDERVSCRVLNVSPSGILIAVERPVGQARKVKLEWGENFLIGDVRYLRSVSSREYQVGLRLLTCSQWREPPVDDAQYTAP